LTHGRKLRECYLMTGLTDCFKIIAVENDVSLFLKKDNESLCFLIYMD
jgi:hypothetical protein